MNEINSSIDPDSELAYLGGRPSRERKITPLFQATPETEERVLRMLGGGVLSDWYGGPSVREFEDRFASYQGGGQAVSVNSGTAALHAAVTAAGLGPGDEVIIPTACFFTAATAVLQQNAIPIMVDCLETDLGLDPDLIGAAVTPRTKAVIVVHMYGYPSRIREILDICQGLGLVLIEDCGQSIGASVDGQKVGTFGEFGCFSLASPRKHVSVGEGGIVLAQSEEAAIQLRRIVNKGKDDGWFTQRLMGFSYTMPEFAAIIGLQGLDEVELEIDRRRKAAKCYDDLLESSGLELEHVPSNERHVYFRKLIRLPTHLSHLRNWMVAAIESENVSAKPPHAPLHKIDWLTQHRAYNGGCPFTCNQGRFVDYASQHFPVADRELERIIDLETGPQLGAADARISAAAVLKVWHFSQGQPEKAEELAASYGEYS